MQHLIWVLSLMTLVACSSQPQEDKSPRIQTVKTFTANAYANADRVSISGVVQEKKTVGLAFRIAGPLYKFPVNEGSYVKKGDLIAAIDPRDYKLKVEAVEAQYEQIKADEARLAKLYESKSVPKSQYDKAVAGLTQITSARQSALNAFQDTRLLAPFDGYIQEKYAENFETINAGRAVVSIIDLNNLFVEAEVSSSMYLVRSQFESFECYPVDEPSKAYTISLEESTKKSNSNQLFKLRFKLDKTANQNLFPGMSVNVSMYKKLAANKSKSMAIPQTCLFSKDESTYVWAVVEGKAQKMQVSIVRLKKDGFAEVLGIHKGTQLVSAGVRDLTEGQAVKPLVPPAKTNVGGLL